MAEPRRKDESLTALGDLFDKLKRQVPMHGYRQLDGRFSMKKPLRNPDRPGLTIYHFLHHVETLYQDTISQLGNERWLILPRIHDLTVHPGSSGLAVVGYKDNDVRVFDVRVKGYVTENIPWGTDLIHAIMAIDGTEKRIGRQVYGE